MCSQSKKGNSMKVHFLLLLPLLFLLSCSDVEEEISLQKVVLSSADSTAPEGREIQVVADGYYSDGRIDNITEDVEWSSTDTTILSVGWRGTFYAETEGIAAAVATHADGLTDTLTITVGAPVLEELEIDFYSGTSFPLGATAVPFVTGRYSNSENWVPVDDGIWGSSDSTVAYLDEMGVLKTVGVGTSEVWVQKDDAVSSLEEIEVTPKRLEKIRISPDTVTTIPVNGTFKYTAIGTYSDESEAVLDSTVEGFQWETINDTKGEINQNGELTALEVGQGSDYKVLVKAMVDLGGGFYITLFDDENYIVTE